MEKGEMLFLSQLIKSLEESELALEVAYSRKDYANFNRCKSGMIKLQKEISEKIK
jgi:hypothetical protein